MRVVAFKGEILEAEVFQIFHFGIEHHSGEGARFAFKLEAGLFQMVCVKMEIPEGVDEFLGPQIADLGDHEGEQGVGGDIEGDAKEEVGASLVKLATEFPIRHIKLEEGMAGGKGHLRDLTRIPGGDDVTAAVGIPFEIGNKARDLIDGTSSGTLRPAPAPPLGAIDRAEITVGIGPFVPDRDIVLLEITDIGIAFQKPEQLMNDGSEMKLLGCQQGEASGEIKAFLGPEDGECARAGSVFLRPALFEDKTEESVILDHRTVRMDLTLIDALRIEERLFLGRKVIPLLIQLGEEAA